MITTIIYIAGIVAAVWCVLDIFKHDKLEPLYKVLLSIAVVAFSWVGFLVYYFLLRQKI
ncbi:MAG: PLDc N-terminal domain-containing protein [Bacteroidales bacterium]|jgi:hypothetical protein|nr:PLDc N-terminal domain-containing protein [Bacteroidales bacterium]